MARAFANKPTFNFSSGKITEASPLTTPENSAKVITNFDINLDGTVKRRLGLDYEGNFVKADIGTLTSVLSEATTSFVWKTVAGVGGTDFFVVQRGYDLDFYTLGTSVLSNNKLGSIDISSQALPGTSVSNLQRMQFSSGRGVLFVTENTIDPCFIEYDSSDDSFTITNIDIEIRDFEGVNDSLEIDFRPLSLSALHEYNIKNQGWFPSLVQVFNAGSVPPIDAFYDPLGVFPSNADLLTAAMTGVQNDGSRGFSVGGPVSELEGNTRAPRGHYILNAFTEDRGSVSGVSGIPSSPIDRRPGTTAFFAGRVWYSGVTDSELGGTLFFSQILTGLEKVGKCYQDQDPTAIDLNALLSTDGGVIEIPEAGKIVKLVPFGRSIIAFATNGIWIVTGSIDSGFNAENFIIDKISNIDAISAYSIAETDSGIFFWSTAGIYSITIGDQSNIEVTNISESTIQTDYLDIDDSLKELSNVFYDRPNAKVYWLYRSDTPGSTLQTYLYAYDKAIILDLKLNAFTDYTFSRSSTAPVILTIAPSEGPVTVVVSENVTVNGVDVTVNAVIVTSNFRSSIGSTTGFKIFTLNPNGSNVDVTVSEFNNRDFSDWETELTTGLDSQAIIITGYELLQDSARNKQIQYMTMHFNRTEQNFITSGSDLVLDFESSCNVQTRWEWTSTGNPNRWPSTSKQFTIIAFSGSTATITILTPNLPHRFFDGDLIQISSSSDSAYDGVFTIFNVTDTTLQYTLINTPSGSATAELSNKSGSFEAYRLKNFFIPEAAGTFDYGYDVVTTKNKIRGHGKSVNFRFTSSEGKDMQLLGWDILYSGSKRV